MEKKLKRVVFEFEDGSKRVLEGKELALWQAICTRHSDYLLPGDEKMILGRLQGLPALIQGFIPSSALGDGDAEWGMKWVKR